MGSGGSKSKPVPPPRPISREPSIAQKLSSRQPSMSKIDEQAPATPLSMSTKGSPAPAPATPQPMSTKGSPAPSRTSTRTHESMRSQRSVQSKLSERPADNDTSARGNDNDLVNQNNDLNGTRTGRETTIHDRSSTRSHISQSARSIKSRAEPLAPIDQPRTSTRVSSKRTSSSGSSSSTVVTDHRGRCPHCLHCQRHGYHYKSSSEPKLKWILDDPGLDQPCIHMDKYDDETLKENLIQEYGHYPGGYDYQPFLTIEEVPEVDSTNEQDKYYKQPKVANNKPRTTPTHTPFPSFKILEQRELRVNKPFSDRLYTD